MVTHDPDKDVPFWTEAEQTDGLSLVPCLANTKLLCQAVEFGAMLKQRTGAALPLEQFRSLANGTQLGRPTGSDQASVADVFPTNGHKWIGFDIALGVYVKGYPSCPRAAILLAVFIVRELTKYNRFGASEFENTLAERSSCGLIKDPVGIRVWTRRHVFSEETNGTTDGHHLVGERVRAQSSRVGSSICGNKAK